MITLFLCHSGRGPQPGRGHRVLKRFLNEMPSSHLYSSRKSQSTDIWRYHVKKDDFTISIRILYIMHCLYSYNTICEYWLFKIMSTDLIKNLYDCKCEIRKNDDLYLHPVHFSQMSENWLAHGILTNTVYRHVVECLTGINSLEVVLRWLEWVWPVKSNLWSKNRPEHHAFHFWAS